MINKEGLDYNPLVRENETTNAMLNTNFKLTFQRIPNISFWCTAVNIPEVTVGEVNISTGILPIHVPGSSVSLGQLNLTFILDEEFSNWNEIYKWMRGTTPFEDFTDIIENEANYFSDATIHCLNSAKRPHMRFTFNKVFPISLAGFELNSALTDTEPVTINASFVYDSFDMEKVT
jgi:hypothetical protein